MPISIDRGILGSPGKNRFFAPNANKLRAPFLSLKPLNGHLLHAIIEYKGFGFVGMAFRRLALAFLAL